MTGSQESSSDGQLEDRDVGALGSDHGHRRELVELEGGLDDALQVGRAQVELVAAVGEVLLEPGELGVEHALALHHPGDRVLLGLAACVGRTSMPPS